MDSRALSSKIFHCIQYDNWDECETALKSVGYSTGVGCRCPREYYKPELACLTTEDIICSAIINFYHQSFEPPILSETIWELAWMGRNFMEVMERAVIAGDLVFVQWWYPVWTEYIPGYVDDDDPYYYAPITPYKAELILYAMEHGHLEIMRWFLKMDYEYSDYDFIEYAARRNQLAVVWRLTGQLSVDDFWDDGCGVYSMPCIGEYADAVRPFRKRFMREIAPWLPPPKMN